MKKLKFLILCVTGFLVIGSAYCDTKKIDVSLAKEYDNGIFNILFDSEISDCKGTLIAPDGSDYPCVMSEDGYMYCNIDDVSSGLWSVELESAEEIGKVTVSVNANSEVADTDEKGVTIVRKIAGLDVYMENSTVKASWTDEKCGDVLVVTSETKTNKTLDSQVISEGGAYEFEVPESYDSISITLVPTALASSEDAKTSFTFVRSEVPKLSVEHDIGNVTNHDTVSVKVITQEICTYQAWLNNTEISADEEFSFDTVEGKNELKITVTNEKGYKNTYTYSFIKDTECPVLTIDNDYSGFSTTAGSVNVSGTVNGATKLTISEEIVNINSDGTFSGDVSLALGNNEIKVVATDDAGNEGVFIMNIYKQTVSTSTNYKDLIVCIGAIIFLIVIIIKRKKKKKTIKTDKKEEISKDSSEVTESEERSQKKEKKYKKKKEGEEKKKRVSTKKFDIMVLITISVIVIGITQFVIRIDIVQSGSMEPNIQTGELMFTNRLYDKKDLVRGDIIEFKCNDNTYCKRIIGLPGDEISFSDGYIILNGDYYKEQYLSEDIETNCIKEFIVPANSFFVLGDNRDNSFDSRYWDNPYIATKNIYGKVIFHVPFLNIFS